MSHAILICDDDPDIRGAMKRTRRGYSVTASGSPREALDMRNSVTASGSPREALDMRKTRTFDAVAFVLRVRPRAAPGGG